MKEEFEQGDPVRAPMERRKMEERKDCLLIPQTMYPHTLLYILSYSTF
jgi:hypothetical protein